MNNLFCYIKKLHQGEGKKMKWLVIKALSGNLDRVLKSPGYVHN